MPPPPSRRPDLHEVNLLLRFFEVAPGLDVGGDVAAGEFPLHGGKKWIVIMGVMGS
jgi:hypothetical protein